MTVRTSWPFAAAAVPVLLCSCAGGGSVEAGRAGQVAAAADVEASPTGVTEPGEAGSDALAEEPTPPFDPWSLLVPLPPGGVPWPADAPPLVSALIAGTWSVDGADGFEQAGIDETGLRVAYTRRAAGRRSWGGLRGDADHLPINVVLRDREGPAMAYVYALVQRDVADPLAPTALTPTPAVLHLRHRGRVRAWFDGRQVLDAPAPQAGTVGHAQASVVLTDAFDVILVKLGRGSPGLGESFDLELRLSAPDGSAIPHQAFNTMRPNHLPPDVPAEMLR